MTQQNHNNCLTKKFFVIGYFNIMSHLQNYAHEATHLLHWHYPVHFILQPQVTVYISGSITIRLLSINTESTEFQPNTTDSSRLFDANIRFEQIETA